jgi:hypothetical protein
MSRILLLLLAVASVSAADDPWTKVRDLKSGTELRVYKKGSAQPVVAKMDQLTDENLIVVVKAEQVAIAREQIDRIDYRPAKSRITAETKTKTNDPDTTPAPPGYGSRTPTTSSSTSVGIGSKPEFEEIYRRPTRAPKK